MILSQFTGAARDLTEAHRQSLRPRQASDALAAALRMSEDEQRERMHSMRRRIVSEFNVYRWAGRMLVDAAETRRRDRMVGRLSVPGRVQVVDKA
ncbi:MAG: hypothetical protein U0235_00740 [Polyangiaceae bacterium]